jgi:hypothetical protein
LRPGTYDLEVSLDVLVRARVSGIVITSGPSHPAVQIRLPPHGALVVRAGQGHPGSAESKALVECRFYGAPDDSSMSVRRRAHMGEARFWLPVGLWVVRATEHDRVRYVRIESGREYTLDLTQTEAR